MENNRVVISGIGVISSIGIGKEAFWNALEKGESGIREISRFDTSSCKAKLGGEIKNFDFYSLMQISESNDDSRYRLMDSLSKLGVAGTKLALEDTDLEIKKNETSRKGVIVGTVFGCLESNEMFNEGILRKGPLYVNPIIFKNTISNGVGAQVAIEYSIKGVNLTFTSGITSGMHAIIYAFDLIKHGEADIIITIGIDKLCQVLFQGFDMLRLLSPQDNKLEGCRPFDRTRNGLVIGEGAGVLILEKLSYALERKSKIYAEIVGFGIASGEENIARAMRLSLENAKILPQKIDYICTSANSTKELDRRETKSIKDVFGECAYKIPISSIKSIVGETFGAGGIFNVISGAMAISEGIIPPTINYENQDPECNLNYVPNYPQRSKVEFVLANTAGRKKGEAISIAMKRYTP
ncbi:MAG: beta-ketoacyl-[acyl-carrier-protein] synthase family protein [bacterium]